MARRARLRTWPTVAGMLAAVLAAAVPASGAAADHEELFPGVTLSGGAADLDGDGSREIVRLVAAPSDATILEAWGEHDGGWLRLGATRLVAPDPIGNATLADRDLGAGALLVARRGGRDAVLALTAQAVPGDDFGRTCCLAIAEVRLSRTAGLELDPVDAPALHRDATVIQAVDLDGDATDELVTIATDVAVDGAATAARIMVLRWSDGDLVAVGDAATSEAVYGFLPGETNGEEGVDLVATTEGGTIVRLVMLAGDVLLEQAELQTDSAEAQPFGPWISGVADGRMVVTGASATSLVRWPNGSVPRVDDRLDGAGFADRSVTVVGTEREPLLVAPEAAASVSGAPPTFEVYDARLELIGAGLRGQPDADVLWRLLERQARFGYSLDSAPPFPYVGPMPAGSWAPSGGFANGGVLISPDGHGGYDERSMSVLAGLYPLTSAGADDDWLVAADGVAFVAGPVAYIGSGMLQPYAPGRLLAIPASTVLAEPPPGAAVTLELSGRVLEIADGSERRLVAEAGGFDVVVTAPPGSTVVQAGGTGAQLEVLDDTVSVTFRPPRASADENSDLTAELAVVTPDGSITTRAWSGRFIADAPSLNVTAATQTGAFAATVRGRASADAAVTIAGRSVGVRRDGSFDVRVDAPPWPAGVVVTARDPLGNETQMRIEVVGMVDYRGLPWAAIAGVATLAGGAYAYVRIPRRHDGGVERDGDGVLEDLEAG